MWYQVNCRVIWKKLTILYISLVRYVILAISVAKNDFIVFMASLGVKWAKNIGVQFFPPLNLVLWHIHNDRHKNHIFGHNLASSKARVTILMSIPMFSGMRNIIVPIQNMYVL